MMTLDLCDSNSVIREGLAEPGPFMAGRFGLTEGSVCWHKGMLGKELGREILHRLAWGVGLFPVDTWTIEEFIMAQRSAALMADAMVEWGKHGWEDKLLKASTPRSCARLHPYTMSAPFFLDADPWTDLLKDKRVLVVHPFADTIIDQHDNHREEIGILPDFELTVIEAPMTFGDRPEGDGAADWLDELDGLEEAASCCDFDVALIGCGGYGLPLAGAIRLGGGKAIHVGGGLQLLFGIRGKRWDQDPRFVPFYNDAWVRPKEKPKGFHKVEGGCYW